MTDLVCKCEPEDWDPSEWVFSHLQDGGWFCMKCNTHMGYFREEFTGKEKWRGKVQTDSVPTPTKEKPKRGLLRRLLGVQ